MNHIDVKHIKKRLAILFTGIVFLIAFFLEITFFSLKYYNISFNEKKEFDKITNQIISQIKYDSTFFNVFISQWIQLKPEMNDLRRMKWPKWWPERWLKFLNFLVWDENGKIIAQNLNQDINISQILRKDISYNDIFIWENEIFLKKIDISSLWNNYKDIIFFKKQWYIFKNYFEDLLLFFMINFIFLILFYYIWLFFVSKNLLPIEETLSDMNDFIHNANHELKTPISVISSNLQIIKTTKNYEEDLILNSIKEIKRIDELIRWLSNLSDIHSIAKIIDLNIQDEIQDIIEELQPDIHNKNIQIDCKIMTSLYIKANKEYFYIMFSNLLRNAIKYNIQNGNINITLYKNKLLISNTWELILNEDLPHIFDRFYKGEKSRNSDGFGIWLSLVKKICDIYHWNIKVTSKEKKETIFEIIFFK